MSLEPQQYSRYQVAEALPEAETKTAKELKKELFDRFQTLLNYCEGQGIVEPDSDDIIRFNVKLSLEELIDVNYEYQKAKQLKKEAKDKIFPNRK